MQNVAAVTFAVMIRNVLSFLVSHVLIDLKITWLRNINIIARVVIVYNATYETKIDRWYFQSQLIVLQNLIPNICVLFCGGSQIRRSNSKACVVSN